MCGPNVSIDYCRASDTVDGRLKRIERERLGSVNIPLNAQILADAATCWSTSGAI